jgi:transcriptional repressor NrdR
MVAKKDGTIEPFDPRKLSERILRAAVKRPVKLKTVEYLVESVQAHFKNHLQKEVSSDKIGEFVLRRLKDIDLVAYVRFASVYRQFEDIDGFVRVVRELQTVD